MLVSAINGVALGIMIEGLARSGFESIFVPK
jgi:hypothetical protein